MARMLRILALCVVTVSVASAAQVQIGATRLYLGDGNFGSTNGTYTTALFNRPEGCSLDSNGDLYVAEPENHVIRKQVVGSLDGPTVAVGTWDSSDDIPGAGPGISRVGSPMVLRFKGALAFVVDYANHKLYKYNPTTRVITNFVGTSLPGFVDGTGTAARFSGPWDLGFDAASSTMYLTEQHRVRSVTVAGVVSHYSGSDSNTTGFADGNSTAARYEEPRGIAVSPTGDVYVSDYKNGAIRLINNTAFASTIAGDGSITTYLDGVGLNARFKGPAGLVLTEDYLFIADKGSNTVRRMDLNSMMVDTVVGNQQATFTPSASSYVASINAPNNLCISAAGSGQKMYITADHAVVVVSLTRTNTVVVSTTETTEESTTTTEATNSSTTTTEASTTATTTTSTPPSTEPATTDINAASHVAVLAAVMAGIALAIVA